MERVTIRVGPVEVSLDPQDGERVCMYEQKAGFEPQSLAEWARIAGTGTVLDVGSYTGLYAIAAAKLGAHRVIAVEPMPVIRKRLKENLIFNDVRSRVSIVAGAASNVSGPATIKFTPAMAFTAGASLSNVRSAHPLELEINTITIDSLGLRDVSAMKIDVEHHELEVIQGAMETIRRCRPHILMECFEASMRERIWKMLPNYAEPVEMDGRNVYLEPL